MTAMGDWARMSSARAAWCIGRDFGEMAFPGHRERLRLHVGHVLAATGRQEPGGRRRLLATIGSVPGQLAANGARQVLSARLDAPPPASDPTLAAKYQLLKDGRLVLALSGMLPRLVDDDLGAALAEMLAQGDPEAGRRDAAQPLRPVAVAASDRATPRAGAEADLPSGS